MLLSWRPPLFSPAQHVKLVNAAQAPLRRPDMGEEGLSSHPLGRTGPHEVTRQDRDVWCALWRPELWINLQAAHDLSKGIVEHGAKIRDRVRPREPRELASRTSKPAPKLAWHLVGRVHTPSRVSMPSAKAMALGPGTDAAPKPLEPLNQRGYMPIRPSFRTRCSYPPGTSSLKFTKRREGGRGMPEDWEYPVFMINRASPQSQAKSNT